MYENNRLLELDGSKVNPTRAARTIESLAMVEELISISEIALDDIELGISQQKDQKIKTMKIQVGGFPLPWSPVNTELALISSLEGISSNDTVTPSELQMIVAFLRKLQIPAVMRYTKFVESQEKYNTILRIKVVETVVNKYAPTIEHLYAIHTNSHMTARRFAARKKTRIHLPMLSFALPLSVLGTKLAIIAFLENMDTDTTLTANGLRFVVRFLRQLNTRFAKDMWNTNPRYSDAYHNWLKSDPERLNNTPTLLTEDEKAAWKLKEERSALKAQEERAAWKRQEEDNKITPKIPRPLSERDITALRKSAESRQLEERKWQEAEKQRQRIIIERRQTGLQEVCVKMVVRLNDIENKEVIMYYLASDKQELKNGHLVYTDNPAWLPDEIELLRTNTPLGKALLEQFVGDQINVVVNDEVTRYLILAAESFDSHNNKERSDKGRAILGDSERQVYSGRGKREGSDSEGMDGSKYLGFLARDNGQWGSFPMHDDFGDESDAEGSDYGDWAAETDN